jgi:hypothetical protein
VIASTRDEADTLTRLAEILHHTPSLPAVVITVATDGHVDLHAIATDGHAPDQVAAWAGALGVAVEQRPATVQAHGMLGCHRVTVWGAAR